MRLGLPVALPIAFILLRQRHFMAMPPSMQASLEPVVLVPVWQKVARFCRALPSGSNSSEAI